MHQIENQGSIKRVFLFGFSHIPYLGFRKFAACLHWQDFVCVIVSWDVLNANVFSVSSLVVLDVSQSIRRVSKEDQKSIQRVSKEYRQTGYASN